MSLFHERGCSDDGVSGLWRKQWQKQKLWLLLLRSLRGQLAL